jgi:uncharacterized protein
MRSQVFTNAKEKAALIIFENIGMVTNLKGRPLRVLRFVADKHLADVADRLRGLGFDVRCDPDLGPRQTVEISRRERRILLTTRAEVLSGGKIRQGLYIRPGGVEEQIQKVMEALNLQQAAYPGALQCYRTMRVCPG